MKPRRLLSWLMAACLLLVFGLVAANAVDYFQFHRAIAQAKGLTEAQLRALGDRCRAVEGYAEFEGERAPAEFHPLLPLRVTLDRGICHAILYECGETGVSVDVETSRQNQQISLWAGFWAPQSNATLWQRDPDLAKKLSPDGRLVTVSLSGIHAGTEWIVLEDEIRVVDRDGAGLTEDARVTSALLTPRDRNEIIDLLRAIGPEVRGKDWMAKGVVDGWYLSVRFSRSGERSSEDIELNNVWIDEIGPLVEAISRFGPMDDPINYRQMITGDPDLRNYRPIVHSLKEKYAFRGPPPRMPWWCVWRRLAH